MSDEQPHQVGSRRRRREIREARERAAAAERERSGESGVSEPTGESDAGQQLFDQEAAAKPFDQVVSPDSPTVPSAEVPSAEEPPADQELPVAAAAGEDDEFAPDAADPILGDKQSVELNEDGTPLLISSSSYGRGYQTVTPVETGVSRSILKHRRQKKRRRNRTLAVALLGFAGLMVAFVLAFRFIFGGLLEGPADYEQQGGEEVTFTVQDGDGWAVVADRLDEEGIVASSEAFTDAITDAEEPGVLHSGEYEMREEMPASDALDTLAEDRESQHYIAVDVGQRIDLVYENMADATGIEAADFREAAEDPTDFGLPEEADSLEGYLAPGEYRFPLDVEADEILQTMVDETIATLEDEGITDPEEQWRTIIVASLVTAEAPANEPDAYPTVAGIIENRLAQDNDETDRLLQIDATVIYGLGAQRVQFTEEERMDESNEYNTYVHPGLPPGPIEAPSPAAIEAAADPSENDYYYWLTVNLETGETRYAETYPEHQENWEEFRDYCDENPEICEGEPSDEAPPEAD